MNERFLAVINPAAGGGRCGKLACAALERLRAAGLNVEEAVTSHSGQGIKIARDAWQRGHRNFIAVGGDGTAFEILNGVFPQAQSEDRLALGFLPLGTGNSFLKDFANRGNKHAAEAILAGRRRRCDVLRLRHSQGEFYFINLLTLGFAADVNALTSHRFKRLGSLGYILGVLFCLARLDRRPFPLRVNGRGELDRRPCLFLAFSNSKYTGGRMKIAPLAETNDGFVEYVRWGPIGRLGLLANLPTLFDGTHIKHPLASRAPVRHIEFQLDEPVTIMIDGESLKLRCESVDVLPGAIDIFV